MIHEFLHFATDFVSTDSLDVAEMIEYTKSSPTNKPNLSKMLYRFECICLLADLFGNSAEIAVLQVGFIEERGHHCVFIRPKIATI